jgi:hemerythrin superfamily protein
MARRPAGGREGKGSEAGKGAEAGKADEPTTAVVQAAGETGVHDQTVQQSSNRSFATTSAIEVLKQDHRQVEHLFAQYKSASDPATKARLIHQICVALVIHTKLEEEIFYAACRDAGCEDDAMDEAQVEHDSAKMLIADLLEAEPEEHFTGAKVSVLAEQIKHHVAEEEKPGEGIFAQAQSRGVDSGDLARRLMRRKQELQGRAADVRPSRVISINVDFAQFKEDEMPRYRDERGRFTDEDDYEGRYGSSRGRGYGHGGWSGDSEGHREAAREGWRERGYGRRSYYDEEDGHRGGYRGSDRERDEYGRFMSDDDRDDRRRGPRYDEDDDGPRRGYRGNDRERDEYGRFTRDDDEDRGYRRGRSHGGWFGDSEGHAEAARHRARAYGRSRDDDDRRYGSGSHDHGGWYGDPRGHAEASRRGWQHRR